MWMDGTKFYIIIINLKCKLSFSVHGGFTSVLIFNGDLQTRKQKKTKKYIEGFHI